MSGSDSSDDEAPLKRVCSVSSPTAWDFVPKETDFKFKYKAPRKKSVRLLYTLKKGTCLPYTATIEDIPDKVTFSKAMQPEAEGKVVRKDGEFWIIEDAALDVSNSSLCFSADASLNDSVTHSEEKSLNGDLSILDDLEVDDTDVNYDPDLVKAINTRKTPDMVLFHCSFCSYVSELIETTKEHIIDDHKNWKAELKGINPKLTPHTYSNWLADLTGDFKQLVISKCSQRAREAVDCDENIQDPRAWKEVYDHIINTTISYLEVIFGGVSVPRLCDMREVATELAVVYPMMFRPKKSDESVKATDGFRPNPKVLGINSLAQLIIDRFRKRAVKKRQHQDPENLPAKNPKKGKRTLIYGVDAKKAKGVEASPEAVSDMAKTNAEEDFTARERVYEVNRLVIQRHFSNSANRILLICRGFMKDSRHLANQFSWLTNSNSLLEKIEKNLITQLGFLEKFLKYMNQTIEFEKEMAEVETSCETEHDGSLLYKYISILRFGARYLDTDGSCLIRMERDGPAKTSGPHIFAISVHKSFVFELHAEKEKLIGNLDLPNAIAALLHIAFVVNLKYPKECQTTCDILQRKVAEYGDDSGTKTSGSKSAAQSKFSKYLDGLGRALSQ